MNTLAVWLKISYATRVHPMSMRERKCAELLTANKNALRVISKIGAAGDRSPFRDPEDCC